MISHPEIFEHRRCRACTADLQEIVNLGALRLNAFPASLPELAQILQVPLILTYCTGCSLVQLDRTVPPDWLYRQYWYRSGVNEMMIEELDRVVMLGSSLADLRTDDYVLDIGANDGTLLSHYSRQDRPAVRRIAVEPARNLQARLAPHCDILRTDYFPAATHDLPGGTVSLITAIACAYDTEDPQGFFAEMARLLRHDGVAVVQFQDFGQQLVTTAFDNICLPIGAPVITVDGLRPIDEVRVGDLVLTDKGRYRPVRETFRRDYAEDLIELTAYGFGHTLRVTPQHPIRVKRAEGWAWIQAEKVEHGDIVGRPIITDVQDLDGAVCWIGNGRAEPQLRRVPWDHLIELCGYYLAEGSIATNGDVLFYFGPHETVLAEDCRSRIDRLGFAATIRETPTTLMVQAHGPLSRLLQRECGRGAEGKRLSRSLLSLPPDMAERLIRAYVAGDGYEYRISYLRASTVSGQLALDMAMLANRVGWKASINEQDRPATCVIEGRPVAQLPLWDVLIHTDPQMKQKVWLEDGYQCGRIRQINRVPYFGMVHNLEVEEDNTYVSPAMTVHNCHEHLEYYTLWSLTPILARAGLRVVQVEQTPINGGSLRVYLRPVGWIGMAHISLAMQLAAEGALGLDIPAVRAGVSPAFALFRQRYQRRVTQIHAALAPALDEGRVVDVYGASTKGNVLLQVLGLGPGEVRQAIDRSPEKAGRFTLTGIPIVGEAEARVAPADLWLCPIWQFRESALRRERWYLEQGGTILFPLPEVEVVREDWRGRLHGRE